LCTFSFCHLLHTHRFSFSFSLSNKVFAHFFQCGLLLFCNRPCVSVPPFLSLVRTTYVIISIVIYMRIIIQDKQAAKKRVLQRARTTGVGVVFKASGRHQIEISVSFMCISCFGRVRTFEERA
jgi:hypothetical protein